MAQRLQLHSLLLGIVPNVYFQPPPDVRMAYPCIVYNRSNLLPRFADNVPYNLDTRYTLTVIDPNPDTQIPNSIAELKQCRFDRSFISDGLNHYVFNILF